MLMPAYIDEEIEGRKYESIFFPQNIGDSIGKTETILHSLDSFIVDKNAYPLH